MPAGSISINDKRYFFGHLTDHSQFSSVFPQAPAPAPAIAGRAEGSELVPSQVPPQASTGKVSRSPSEEQDESGPHPSNNEQEDEEPEFDPDSADLTNGEPPQFPTTHEMILKDHTKVVSALALDPSGARVLSGSHDYDCKLWDFGGMDMRCKPFKTWEPNGSYYVRSVPLSLFLDLPSLIRCS